MDLDGLGLSWKEKKGGKGEREGRREVEDWMDVCRYIYRWVR